MYPIIRAALTPRQKGVCELLMNGLPNRQIAAILGTTASAVKSALRALYIQFEIQSPAGDRYKRGKRTILVRMLNCRYP